MIKSEKVAIYAEGDLAWQNSKTTEGMLRYRDDIVCVIDNGTSGEDAGAILGVHLPGPVPIVPHLAAAMAHAPDTLLIGFEPTHSRLPGHVREVARKAIIRGMNVISGLHYFLGDDPDLAALARERGVTLWDVRKPPQPGLMSRYEPRRPGAKVVLTIGSDMYVGKMTATLEMYRIAQTRGVSSEFVATGQIGMMIGHAGVPADAITSDFLNGHVDKAVREAAVRSDWVFVEGQAALNNPTGSQVTLGLLHGALPDFMVLCHRASATHVRHYENCRIPPLPELVRINEEAVNWLHHSRNSRVCGIALNTAGFEEAEARRIIDKAEQETGLPATDVVRFGAEPMLDSLPEFPGES
jgi:uncharacterized NAD-dependent epimerase/dehydratase family protein